MKWNDEFEKTERTENNKTQNMNQFSLDFLLAAIFLLKYFYTR